MEAHTYRTLFDYMGNGDPIRWYGNYVQSLENQVEITHAALESNWVYERRPYYTVFPLAAAPLARIPLTIPCDQLKLPMQAILIRFLKGKEPVYGDKRLQTILAGNIDFGSGVYGLAAWIDFGERESHRGEELSVQSFVSFPTHKGGTVEEQLLALPKFMETMPISQAKYVEGDSGIYLLAQEPPEKCVEHALRYVVAISLLAHDPDIIEPDVLDKDRAKYAREPTQAIIDRAVRRGKRGWLVGAKMESMPHYRRPHFAVRWTGEGRTIPRIVPIKGSVVHRSKLNDVPQGYLEDEKESADVHS